MTSNVKQIVFQSMISLNEGHDRMNLLAKKLSQESPFKGANFIRIGTMVVKNSGSLNTEWETGLQSDK